MMIFTVGQLDYLRARASQLLSKLKEWEKHDDNTKIGIIENDFMEICSMGHAIAFDEIQSSPWEFMRCMSDIGAMNSAAKDGWELITLHDEQGTKLTMALWRRRSLRKPKGR